MLSWLNAVPAYAFIVIPTRSTGKSRRGRNPPTITNDICDWDSKEELKDLSNNYGDAGTEPELLLADQIRVCPNPNNGTFILKTDLQIQKENIQLYDLTGRKLAFTYSGQSVSLLSKYTGVVILHLSVQDEIVIKRLMIK